MDAALSVVVLLAAVPILYGLHRLGLCLERRDVIYYWHKKPSGGSAYNPLQELVQPQIRHVIEVGEQRQGEAADGEGAPPDESSNRADRGGCNGGAPP
jgi:hypothetical protein